MTTDTLSAARSPLFTLLFVLLFAGICLPLRAQLIVGASTDVLAGCDVSTWITVSGGTPPYTTTANNPVQVGLNSIEVEVFDSSIPQLNWAARCTDHRKTPPCFQFRCAR